MNNDNFVKPIIDACLIDKLKGYVVGIVNDSKYINSEWIKSGKYTAVPVESAGHFDESDATRLADALQVAGYNEIFAIATEPLGDVPHCYKVTVSKEGLVKFSHVCSPFNFLLIPEDPKLAVLCTVYDYFLVAGPQAFVEAVVGKGIDSAREEFKNYACSWNDEYNTNRLINVLQKHS